MDTWKRGNVKTLKRENKTPRMIQYECETYRALREGAPRVEQEGARVPDKVGT
eukprot:COSAG05_NODE_2186_length_3428_cov_2.071493_5_plen_53_part_00